MYRPKTPPSVDPPVEDEVPQDEEDDNLSKGPSDWSAPVRGFASDYLPTCLDDLAKATTTDERKISYCWLQEAVRQETGPRRKVLTTSFDQIRKLAMQAGDDEFISWMDAQRPKSKGKGAKK